MMVMLGIMWFKIMNLYLNFEFYENLDLFSLFIIVKVKG